MLMFAIQGIVWICGKEDAFVYVDGKAINGWRGAVIDFFLLLCSIPVFSLIAAFAVFEHRCIRPWLGEKLSRLIFWKRR